MNPTLTLTVSGALRDRFATDARFAAVLERFTALLDATEHKLLSVRRVVEGGGLVYRSIRTLDQGTSVEMTRALVAMSGGNVVDEGYTTQAWRRWRCAQPPYVEECLVVAPSWIEDKQRPGFEARWSRLIGEGTLFDVSVA